MLCVALLPARSLVNQSTDIYLRMGTSADNEVTQDAHECVAPRPHNARQGAHTHHHELSLLPMVVYRCRVLTKIVPCVASDVRERTAGQMSSQNLMQRVMALHAFENNTKTDLLC